MSVKELAKPKCPIFEVKYSALAITLNSNLLINWDEYDSLFSSLYLKKSFIFIFFILHNPSIEFSNSMNIPKDVKYEITPLKISPTWFSK